MDNVIVRVECRSMVRYAVAATGSPPAASPTEPATSTPGVAQLTVSNFAGSSQNGVAAGAIIIPGRTGSGTYTLEVHGLRLLGDVWHPVLLWQGTVACTYAPGGTPSANSFNTGEFGPTTFTTGAGIAAASCIATSPGGTGMGSLVINTNGCPYLFFRTSDVLAFVLAGASS